MLRRELRDLSSALGADIIRFKLESNFGFSIRDGRGIPVVVFLLDTARKRVVEVIEDQAAHVPSEVMVTAARHIIRQNLDPHGFHQQCGLVRDRGGILHPVFDMPDDLVLDDAFYFHTRSPIRLPVNLRSTSDFILIGAEISRMCVQIDISGDADFSECSFETFPDGATFRRNLTVSRSSIKKFGRSMTVGRNLKMVSTQIEALPVSARVGGSIDAESSSLRVIPPGFSTGGDLIVSGTPFLRLHGLNVGGSLYIERTAVERVDGDCSITGNIYTDNPNLIVQDEIHDEGRVYIRNPFGYERLKRSMVAE